MKTLSLKTRLRLLLGIAFVIPLLLLWVFTSSQVNRSTGKTPTSSSSGS